MHMKNHHLIYMKKMHGFTMIEVLISMFILAIGILGASALQLTSLNANTSAMYRTQAIFLANDIIDRMRRDPITARGTRYNSINTGTAATASGCGGTTGCSPDALAANDIAQWVNYFRRTTPLLPNGTGTVVRQAGNVFRITISWDDKDKLTRSTIATSHTIDVQI
jgi:type IV pilus assembly protein PilV